MRPLIERKPYFTTTEPLREYTYKFRPVPETGARAYHIADAHNAIAEPVAAAKAFGKIDFLILNGDIIDHSGNPSKFDNIYQICAELTQGEVPTVFSRGNHDMRGNFAENFAEYTPNSCGNTYYTFRLGSIWGVLLDCGEDKDDSHAEYGHTVCCHAFRKRQTAFLREIIAKKESEFAVEGVKTRLVISHNPFTQLLPPPFDIEKEIYAEWAALLRENMHPNLMICGHFHRLEVNLPGSTADHLGQPCPVVIGAKPAKNYFIGCGFVFGENDITVTFTDSRGAILEEHTLPKS